MQRLPRACQCPLWVMSRHRATSASCPFFPSKQTFVSASGTSALCHNRTFCDCHLLPRHMRQKSATLRQSRPRGRQDLRLTDKLASNFHSCFSPRTSRIVGTLPVKRLECQVLSGTPSLLSGLNSGRSQQEAINDPQSFSRPWNSRRTNAAVGDLRKAWRRRSWSWRWSPYACWRTRS